MKNCALIFVFNISEIKQLFEQIFFFCNIKHLKYSMLQVGHSVGDTDVKVGRKKESHIIKS